MFVNLKRPDQSYGFYGKKSAPGLVDLLNKVVLDPFVEMLQSGKRDKKIIIFCRDKDTLGLIDEELCDRLPEYAVMDPDQCPWVFMHGNRGKVTEHVIRHRTDVSAYLATTGTSTGRKALWID